MTHRANAVSRSVAKTMAGSRGVDRNADDDVAAWSWCPMAELEPSPNSRVAPNCAGVRAPVGSAPAEDLPGQTPSLASSRPERIAAVNASKSLSFWSA
jgi:hypothetical protein